MVSISEGTTLKRKAKRATTFVLFLFSLLAFSLVAFAQTSTSCPIAAYEGDLVRLSPEAFDPDPEIGPAGELLWSFGPPFDSAGEWQTVKGLRGIFYFWVSVSDGELKDTEYSCVDVLPRNRNPILSPVPEVYLKQGESANLQASCYDPDGDPVTIEYFFRGRNVAFIYYEPPGTYDLQVVCADGFGGQDVEQTKLHVLMPEEPTPAPKPVQVITAPEEVELVSPQVVEVKLQKPCDIEVVLPAEEAPQQIEVACDGAVEPCAPDVVEVRYPRADDGCPVAEPAPVEDIEVVLYNTTEGIYETFDTTSFVVEEPAPAPAQEPVAEPVETVSPCDEGLERKEEISRAIGCC